MWKSANLLLKSSRLVTEMTLLGSRFHKGIRDGKKVFLYPIRSPGSENVGFSPVIVV